ncbi:MAG: GNAT family N-acetyltransferase [Moheibacter sp.]
MKIRREDDGKKGAFTAVDGETQAGLMTYVWAGDKMFIIDHTEVDAAYGGQGIGKKMVMAAVDFARENHLKINPLCPFAKSVFDKVEEINDVKA